VKFPGKKDRNTYISQGDIPRGEPCLSFAASARSAVRNCAVALDQSVAACRRRASGTYSGGGTVIRCPRRYHVSSTTSAAAWRTRRLDYGCRVSCLKLGALSKSLLPLRCAQPQRTSLVYWGRICLNCCGFSKSETGNIEQQV